MKPSIAVVGGIAALCGLGQAVLMVAGGSPFTPSYIQGIGVMGGVLIVMAIWILHNIAEIKRMRIDNACNDAIQNRPGSYSDED